MTRTEPQRKPLAPPDKVGLLAARHGFGELVDVRREVPMTAALVAGWGTAVVSALLLWAAASLGRNLGVFSFVYSILHAVAFVFVFGFLWGVAYGIRGLVVGSRVHYLFDGGLVARRRTGLEAVAWADVASLKTVYSRRRQGDEGRVLGYRVNTAQGRGISIPLLVADGRDAFMDVVIARVRERGKPID